MIPKPADGRHFTPRERAEIAARYDRIAAESRIKQQQAEARGPLCSIFNGLHLALEAERISNAARTSSEDLVQALNHLTFLHR